MIKYLTLSLTIIILACSNNKVEQKPEFNFGIQNSYQKMSDVLASLQVSEVTGYVLISKSALEYSSAQMAREDISSPKSVVQFDVERFDYHTPKSIGDDGFHHWGSSLICRQVITDHGDVVEVLTLDPDEDPEKLGHGGLGADYLFKLTTYLRKCDLVPVLNTLYTVEYDNGTFIQFEPGVAVGIPWDSPETQRAVSIQNLHFGFPVPDSLLSLSYLPIMKTFPISGEDKMLDEHADLFLGDGEFCPVSEIRNERLRTPVSANPVGDQYLVELRENGIRMKLLTDMKLTDNYIPNIERPVLTSRWGDNPPQWYYRLLEGIPIYWQDGRLAGEMRQYVGHYSHQGPVGSTICEIMPEHFTHLPICFKLSDIEVHQID